MDEKEREEWLRARKKMNDEERKEWDRELEAAMERAERLNRQSIYISIAAAIIMGISLLAPYIK